MLKSKVLSAETTPTKMRKFPWLFFVAAFGIAWLVWVPFAIMSQKKGTQASVLLDVGSFGPTIAGILMTYRSSDKRARRDFWGRTFSFGSISLGGYLFIFVAIPALYLIAVLVDCLVHKVPLAFPYYSQILSRLPVAIQVSLFLIVVGPLTEELGWRGFALDRLQAKRNPLTSALILGVVWWAWHLPLFFIRGTTHGNWGFGSPWFFLFLPFTISLSVLITWLYNSNRRSIVSAILIHFTSNTASGLLPATTTAFLFATCLLMVTAMLVVACGGTKSAWPRES